jgi:hypothetical protein
MWPLKGLSLITLVFLVPILVGCGSEETVPQPPQPGTNAVQKGGDVPNPVPAEPAHPLEMDVDFASLAKFPDLQFEAIGTIPEEGDPRVVLMDGAAPANPTGQTTGSFWVAKPPAQYIVHIPTDKGRVRIDKVTVEDAGGDKSFMLCSVSIMTKDQPDWKPPQGLTSRKELVKTPEGEWVRTIIQFDEVPATGIRISFPAGNTKQPDRVYVRDIDVIGDLGG